MLASRNVPFRVLSEVSELSYGDKDSGNMLIEGDNLDALKSLLPFYAGSVKCIYIDPPYNTKSAFKQYDDNLENSQWIAMMWPRLELLRELLAEEGSIWISIDDTQAHYLKVLGDEVFGRSNFILDIAWQKRDGPPNDRKIGMVHEHILVWAKHREGGSKQTLAERHFNLMPRTEKANAQYKVFDEPSGPDPRGAFRKIDTTANGKGGRFVQSLYYPITNPHTGEDVYPREGTCWRHKREDMERLQEEGRLYWGVKGTARTPMRKLYLKEAKQGMTAPSVWSGLALNQHASSEMEKIFGQKAAFETPKPEGLIQRILQIATNQGDLVLDCFLGSGTTIAVAHKMNRRYIGVEMGGHARTHCRERMKKVVDGDGIGVSVSENWKGGGGFRFFTLGAPIFDDEGAIRPTIRFADLATHIWFSEFRSPRQKTDGGPLLGINERVALALLYNGILGDKSISGGNVLNRTTLALIREQLPAGFEGDLIVYGERTVLSERTLKRESVTFKQTPYDVKVRA